MTSVPFRLDGKNAVVTGAGSGIGQAIAELFAAQGADVWVVDRDQAGARATVDGIRAAGGRADAATVDVTDEAAVAAMAATLPPIDVLVNNAGIGHVGNLTGTTVADLDRLYAVNVRGVFNGCKVFAPPMMERGRGGVINCMAIDRRHRRRARSAGVHGDQVCGRQGLTKALALDHSALGRALQLHLPGARRDTVREAPPGGVARSRAGVPRHGGDPAHRPDGAARGDRGGGPLPGGR